MINLAYCKALAEFTSVSRMRQQNPDGRLVTTTPPTSGTGPRRETPLCLIGFVGLPLGHKSLRVFTVLLDRLRAAPCPVIPTRDTQASSPSTRGHEDTRPKFAVGRVVAEAAEPHSALEVVAVEDGLYTLRYRTDDAWRGHEITRVADDLVPFGFLPKRAKPTPNYRIA